jgi:hypothetical protein
MKSLFVIVGLAFVAILTAYRREQGRKKLALLESGKMCVHCGSTNVTPGQKGVLCGACGQTTSWTLINHPSLSKEEIDKVSARDDRHPML